MKNYRLFFKEKDAPPTAKSCKHIEMIEDDFISAVKLGQEIEENDRVEIEVDGEVKFVEVRLVMVAELPN